MMPNTPKGSSLMMKKVHHPHPPYSPLQNRPKTAVRAKSGCYTCRIRRKKCDERRIGDETGPCETCIRLKLECLGFGAKRPEWLRDSQRVQEIRDRIKTYLASQGMIKGHAGSGSRLQLSEDYLRLSDARAHGPHEVYHSGTSSSGGSPVREDSVESEQYHPQLALGPPSYNLSSIRSYAQFYTPAADMLSSRCDSPSDPHAHPYEHPDQPYIPVNAYYTPAKQSKISTLYHAQFTIDPEPEYLYDPVNPSPSIILPSVFLPEDLITKSMREYVNDVVKIQYLLGDKWMLPNMIWDAVMNHSPSQEAVNLLAQTYHARHRDGTTSVLANEEMKQRVSNLKETLKNAELFLTADDAMAALHVVSLYLFDGGQGKWNEFLSVACTYVTKVLEDPRYFRNYPEALEGASPKDGFVVKTTIWFDVLASITTMKPPVLLEYIRALFHPNTSWVGAPKNYTMMSPMGCENVVVWALAEASYLSCWKRKHVAAGDLSIRQLVYQIQEIEPYLQPGPRPIQPQPDAESWSRYLASEIFRTSTKLFLKSVESGDYPHVQEMRECVQETLAAILEFPNGSTEMTAAIVRNTVFGFYVCGSLTDSEQVLTTVEVQLTQSSGDGGVGNTSTISSLLRELWEERRLKPQGHPVQWRQLLKKREILLV